MKLLGKPTPERMHAWEDMVQAAVKALDNRLTDMQAEVRPAVEKFLASLPEDQRNAVTADAQALMAVWLGVGALFFREAHLWSGGEGGLLVDMAHSQAHKLLDDEAGPATNGGLLGGTKILKG